MNLALVLTLAKQFSPFELHFLFCKLGVIGAQPLRVVVMAKCAVMGKGLGSVNLAVIAI